MKAFQSADGGVLLSQRNYDIAADTEIAEGQVLVLTNGLVTKAAAGETGYILGIAAESHKGAADAINPRANGKEILVYDSPVMIMICPAPRLTATSGSSTTIVDTTNLSSSLSNNAFKGGYVKLVKKGAESTNTDEIGTVRAISASTGSTSTLTIASGGTVCAGDVYELYPPIGLAAGNLDTNRQAIVYSATASISLKVVMNRREGFIGVMASKHVLGGA